MKSGSQTGVVEDGGRSAHSRLWPFTRSLVLFAVIFVLSLVVFPTIAWTAGAVLPNALTNFLFFWPQMVLAYYGLQPVGDPTTLVLSPHGAIALAIGWWLVVAMGFAWLMKNRSLRFAIAAVLPALFLSAIATQLVLAAAGLAPYFDGP